jgi:phenylpropionate dioxygenase-like ring-hydroxylating dioxygenase large terminal subunit
MARICLDGRWYDVADANQPFGEASTLPREFYLDPDLFRHEVDRVLAPGWLPVARVEQVARPGDYLATEVCGEQLLVVRDQDGTLRVLSNVCRHRAMPLASGQGSCRVLRCPYHLWSYRLDGTLSGAPMMAGNPSFDRAATRLPAFRHEIWQGWVMVNLDGTAQPLAERTAGLTRAIVGWGFDDLRLVASARYDCDWNWKLTIENFCEYYHHLGLHQESLEPFLPARAGRCLDNDGQPWNSSIITCAEEYLELQGAPMSGLDCQHTNSMQIFTVFPLLCAGAQPSSGFWLQVDPVTADRHVVTWHVLVRPERAESDDIADFTEVSLKAIDVLQQEDGTACRGVQAGLRSRSARPGRFAALEKPIWQFQRWLLTAMADGFR